MNPHDSSADPLASDGGASDLYAYLDGTLSGEARAAFEARLASDAGLRAELELQRRIDARLRALADAPDFPGLPEIARPVAGRIGAGASDAGRGRAALPVWVRVAAVMMVGALGVWAAVTKPWNQWLGPVASQVAVDALYDRLVRTGFEPATVCDSDAKFLDYTAKELGTPFLVGSEPGVRLVGWTYTDGVLGERAMVLMARRAETPVIVIMDRAANDRAVRVEPGSSLRVHRATLGGVVFYEVGPDPAPTIVNHLKPGS